MMAVVWSRYHKPGTPAYELDIDGEPEACEACGGEDWEIVSDWPEWNWERGKMRRRVNYKLRCRECGHEQHC